MTGTADALAAMTARLAEAGIEEPRREARLILAASQGVDAAGLLLLREVDEARYAPLVRRRAAREPLAYILGRKEFWGLEFKVSPATLIPRPDTETLVEAVVARGVAPARVLDLGTGTGCLLLAVLSEFPAAFGVGVDISPAAAALAAGNAKALGLAGRAAFCVSDWDAALLRLVVAALLALHGLLPALALVGLRVGYALRLVYGADNPEIMLGMLVIGFAQHSVSVAGGVARHLLVLLEKLLRRAPHPHFRA